MILDQKFGSNCDQGFPRRLWRGDSAISPALVLVGLVIMGTTAIAARVAVVSIAPATAAIYAGVGMPVNLRDLSIADVRATTTQQPDGPGDLLVTGEIANLRDRETPAPKSSPGPARRRWARALRVDCAGTEDQPRRA